ncbi:Cu(I)/Ag(I) efflux system membrane protein CusA/SilA [Maribacter vaceletii]|uniref:Cu(I)/Ag(I) efflux system membrane protein CusA/SilA n=1 Tax=Maribacter vaceletii TaxID=1206816 RepID=A0A495DVT5_9FLAO|nr:efflux RND transporter permease subunit [Maribacter vaceletii]RKR07707.1 Cu(I)/Ag(I) efflux system membrane protein CusA/SilA [Maribacter vaceletii]
MLNKSIKFLIENKLVALILLFFFFAWGIIHAPFNLGFGIFPSNPVSVDAIPNIGENQQIVYTEWEGKSPQDIEDQITYPLTSSLLGTPGVKSVRSSSMFGFSSIYVIFKDDVDFYWSRSRLLEKLNALPTNLLPNGVKPTLGPDATALGQIFWYTLEGRDEKGEVTGGWDLHEIRSIQDFYVKNALLAADGVSEVASIGGFTQEYQIDINPELMRQYNITIADVVKAVKESNKDVGAKTIEINQIEYFVRGLGYIKNKEDIENTQVTSKNFTPIKIKDIAKVAFGPAERRGVLDKEGAEVVGGVVVARYGENPINIIKGVKDKIKDIVIGLPTKTLKDGRVSKLTIVPFYDRTTLIKESINTLGDALTFEILITILVVIVMLFNLRVSILISGLMPVAVLMVFIAMKLFKVDANIVALSGIAIAIGTMVDMGIILSENIIRHLETKQENENVDKVVYNATIEVSGAIITAGLTTIISFIPVFTLTGAEGKLFVPLAFTKTAALTASMVVALFVIPPFAAKLFQPYKAVKRKIAIVGNIMLAGLGIITIIFGYYIGALLLGFAILGIIKKLDKITKNKFKNYQLLWSSFVILILLSYYWRPLSYGTTIVGNLFFVVIICLLVLGVLLIFRKYYEVILVWALANKVKFLSIPIGLLFFGILIMANTGKEFMPSLDEGSFLLMPTSLPHSGTSENKRILTQLDMAVAAIPEIETVVGKAGRVSSALDPAPLSMYENIILYKPEFILDKQGSPISFKVNEENFFETKEGDFVKSGEGYTIKDLIIDDDGEFYRNWRPEIRNRDDIWEAIVNVTKLPGVTTAPKLQPIETRLVMLQTGMRAPMGIKVKGNDLKSIEALGITLEKTLKTVKGVKKEAVFADRIVGKPYLLVDIDREKIARYGVSILEVQELLEVAVGGKILTHTVEGRERYSVRVRYPRELRATPEDIEKIYLSIGNENSIPLSDVVTIRYEKGPQIIKSEDGFLVGYVLFDKEEGFAEVNVIENAKEKIESKITDGELKIKKGLSYSFSGTYENQLHAEKTLSFIVPLVLLVIFLILYLQFRSVSISLMVFTGVAVAFAGGFILIWLYGQSWFMNFSIGAINLRELFHIKTINLSVAIWVGFIALFGIATDDGVIMATYLKQTFNKNNPGSITEVRDSVLEAGKKRIRPCLMTTGTTILALLPILTATGKGSDIMIPMAIPSFGGMLVALISLFIVPVLFSWYKESKLI